MINAIQSPIPASPAFAGLDDRLRVCVELLVAGVAFQTDTKTWEVFSHDGEHIGTMSTFWVHSTICAMKKQGWRSSTITSIPKGEQASLTLGHEKRNTRAMTMADWDALMDRRHRKFVTMQ